MHVYSRLNGFHDLIVFTIMVFHNTRETFSKEKKFQQARNYSSLIWMTFSVIIVALPTLRISQQALSNQPWKIKDSNRL